MEQHQLATAFHCCIYMHFTEHGALLTCCSDSLISSIVGWNNRPWHDGILIIIAVTLRRLQCAIVGADALKRCLSNVC